MLTLACVVHAHWCFHGNGGAAWAFAPPEREGQRRAPFHRASKQTEKHTNQITPKQDYNACESILFTHIFTLLCIKKNIYILPRSTNVLSFLYSVIWIWWGSAPPAPNVETPLRVSNLFIVLKSIL